MRRRPAPRPIRRPASQRRPRTHDIDRQRQIWDEVEAQLGDAVICAPCGATVQTYADRCKTCGGCPGFDKIDAVRGPIVAKVYGWKDADG